MKLKNIEKIWHYYNDRIFTRAGCRLSVMPHYRTRARDYWACWDNGAWAYYWSNKFGELGSDKYIRSLIAHEMVHQWQDEYMPEFYFLKGPEYNPHDKYFFSWRPWFKSCGLILLETM